MTSPEKDKMVGEKRDLLALMNIHFQGLYLNIISFIFFILSPPEVINFALNLHTRILQRHCGPGSWK